MKRLVLALLGVAITAATVAAAPFGGTSPAMAAKGGICEGFKVVVNGQTFSGTQKRTINGPINSIFVDGKYIEFHVAPATFRVNNYVHTGVPSPRADKNLPFNGRTTIFTSKVPNHGKTLTSPLSLEINAESLVLQRSGGGQSMKIQAKDCHQGGLFQMEPQPGTTEVNTLGTGWHYTGRAPGSSRLCISNGRISAYDSPELASLISFTAQQARWNVQAGGRIGFVIGEDAVQAGCRP
jgi:hypothetical protein